MLAYVSARNKILRFIKTSNLRAGDRLPTEVELSEQLDISRLTLREAMNTLKNEGVIRSVQGKGTFVTCNYDYIANTLNTNNGITEMIEVSGYTPGVASFEKRLVQADCLTAKGLKIEKGTDVVMCARIRLADGVPVVYSKDFISPRLTSEFLKVTDKEISLYAFIEETCGIDIGVSTTELVPTLADEEKSKLLNVPVDSPLMEIRATVNDILGEPLLYAIEYLRPDKFKFLVLRRR